MGSRFVWVRKICFLCLIFMPRQITARFRLKESTEDKRYDHFTRPEKLEDPCSFTRDGKFL